MQDRDTSREEGGAPPAAVGAEGVDSADLAACLRVLGRISLAPALAVGLPEVGEAVARAYKRVRKDRRKQAERQNRTADRAITEATGRCRQDPRPAELLAAGVPPRALGADGGVAELSKSRSCYVCKADFRRLHSFYHLLCPDCAAENYARRIARADMGGRRALVTGGRIKIGYHTALKLLRDGAEVVVTTRFPKDAARRYAREGDFSAWRHRIRLYELDLRNLPAVYAFADHLADTLGGLDVLINNAAQTVRREPAFYQALREREAEPAGALPDDARALLAELPGAADAPGVPGVPAAAGGSALGASGAPILPDLWHWPDDLAYDIAGRPRDARSSNSWVQELPDVEPAELAEVMLVNAMAPFALCSRLEPLMRRSEFPDRYVVNVSAMEGQFARGTKTSRHPHTNMAKAALNMLTRTAAGRLAREGIFMNSVDTGWVTEENPHPKRARLRARGFVPPLDEVDGAARVYDPVLRGVGGQPVFGLFLKDYRPIAW